MNEKLKREIALKAVNLTDKMPVEKVNPIKEGNIDMDKKMEIAKGANNLEGKPRLDKNLLHNLKLPKNKFSARRGGK